MQTRRPGKQTDHKVSPGALAAIAEAARRSREAGVGPEPRRSRTERPSTGGVADQPVTASAAPQATQPVVTTAPTGRPPTGPVTTPGAGPTPAPSSDGMRWAGSPPPAGAPVSPNLPRASPRHAPDVPTRVNVACDGPSASPSAYWSSWWPPSSVRPTMVIGNPAVRPRRPDHLGLRPARHRAARRARPPDRVRRRPPPLQPPPPRQHPPPPPPPPLQPPPPRRRWPSPTDPRLCRPWHRPPVRPDRR